MATLRAWEGLAALCVVALLLASCGVSAPPAAAQAPAGVLRSIWQGQVQIAASVERDAHRADERVRRGRLFAAFDFLNTLDYASKFAAVLRGEAGSPKSCPGDGQPPSG